MGRSFEANFLAEVVAARVLAELRERDANEQTDPGGWMNTTAAAAYAGCSVHSLRKATASREVEFRQDTAGGKCWFLRTWIDDWRGL